MSVPLTILTGFLGAGKTTLLERLVSAYAQRGERLAIVQNELADLDKVPRQFRAEAESARTGPSEPSHGETRETLEQSRVRVDGEVFDDYLELANGCVCCSVRDNFVEALEQLCKKQRFHGIVLECSGAADPGTVVSMFWSDSPLHNRIRLDVCVAVVDSVNFERHLSQQEAVCVARQVAFADAVLLNKNDLVSTEKMQSALQAVRQINSTAQVFACTRCDVDLTRILGRRLFEQCPVPQQSHQHACSHDASIQAHVIDVGSEEMSESKLCRMLAEILWNFDDNDDEDESQTRIFRIKGVFVSRRSPQKRRFLQSVQELFEFNWGPDWDTETPRNRFAVIGRNISESELRLRLQCAIASEDSESEGDSEPDESEDEE